MQRKVDGDENYGAIFDGGIFARAGGRAEEERRVYRHTWLPDSSTPTQFYLAAANFFHYRINNQVATPAGELVHRNAGTQNLFGQQLL